MAFEILLDLLLDKCVRYMCLVMAFNCITQTYMRSGEDIQFACDCQVLWNVVKFDFNDYFLLVEKITSIINIMKIWLIRTDGTKFCRILILSWPDGIRQNKFIAINKTAIIKNKLYISAIQAYIRVYQLKLQILAHTRTAHITL